MKRTGRLDKLSPMLSAKERGILVLRSLKTGERENHLIGKTMPSRQVPEFNRLIGLMNGVNGDLNIVVGVLGLMVDKPELKSSWYSTLILWATTSVWLWRCIEESKEPITKREYAQLKAAEEDKPFGLYPEYGCGYELVANSESNRVEWKGN